MGYDVGYGYALAANLSAAAGTAAIAAGDPTVTGTGTQFGTDIQAGDVIVLNGVARVVASITSATSLEADADWDETASGLAIQYANWQYLDTDLNIPAPRGVYAPYTTPVPLLNGGVRGAGWEVSEWRWGFLTQAQRNALRAFCPGASALLYVRTRPYDDSDAYVAYRGQMIWPAAAPEAEERHAGRRLNFTLRFQALERLSA